MATVHLVLKGGGNATINNVPTHEAKEMERNHRTPGHIFRIEGAHGVTAIAAEQILLLSIEG